MSVRIAIIIPYFGKCPAYMDHFLAGCGFNTSIDWLLITDIEFFPEVPENIHFIKSDLDAFNKLAVNKLGFSLNIKNPYKLCDFKPAYGLIFEDWLEKYDYWGYCDIDLILGKIEQFLSFDIIKPYDIISTYKGFLSGPFCLFRNSKQLKTLFTIHRDYKAILQDTKYLGFDENIQRSSISGFSFHKLIYFFQYILISLFESHLYSFSFKEFRYQYQWFVKRKTISEQNPADMTEIAFLKHRIGEIKVFTDELLFSDSYYKRLNRKTWRIKWEKGILTDMDKTRQIFGFHFRESKNKMGFTIQEPCELFTITEKGIFNK